MTGSVYRGYDREALDRQYDQGTLVPNIADYVAAWAERSATARRAWPARLDLACGSHPRQRADVFPAGARAPALVFFHGGAWRSLGKDHCSYLAPAFVGAGVTLVVPGFALVPDVALDEQVHQARAALAWLFRSAAALDVDPGRLFVAGHSSGAHLAAMLATTDWARDWGLPPDVIKGVTAVSGIFDLEPVRLSARNRYLRLDARAAERNSPLRRINPAGPPLLVACGEDELDEFRRQARDFAAAWRRAGLAAEFLQLPGHNHFDMADALAAGDGPLGSAVLRQVTAAPEVQPTTP